MRGEWKDPALALTPFGEWHETWKRGVVHLRPSTLARDDGYIKRYILPTFKDKQLKAISQPTVQAWVAELTRRDLAAATVVKAHQILSKIMSGAIDAGMIATNPCTTVRLPRIERTEMRFLTAADVAILAAAMDPAYRAAVWLAAYGGLRAGELFGLRAKRVDTLHQRVEVAEQLVEVEGGLHFGQPKTRAGHRSVPLPDVVIKALSDHMTTYPVGPEELVFTAPKGGPVRLASWRQRYWVPAVKKAGLTPLRIHDLRHTAVSLWIEAGAHPYDVAARAGHQSVSVVLDRYGHLMPGAAERVNDALDVIAKSAAAGAKPKRPRSQTIAHVARTKAEKQ